VSDYQFSTRWFQAVKPIWDQLFATLKPAKVLEIGSFEGASACYLIEKIGTEQPLELHCIDTWEGGIEHQSGGYASDMSAVEKRFHHNIALAQSKATHPISITLHKQRSDLALAQLLAKDHKQNYFDLIYVDGSHQAPDVLFDAVVSFKFLSLNGLMIFDDYSWAENLPQGKDILRCPKPAIDAFVNLNFRKLRIVPAPLPQFYVIKTSD